MEGFVERDDWFLLSRMYVSTISVIKDIKDIDPNLAVERIMGLINNLFPNNNGEDIKLGEAKTLIQLLSRARNYNIDHPSIAHYMKYSEIASESATEPVSLNQETSVNDVITYPDYWLYKELGDRYTGLPCFLDQVEMDKRNWLLGWKRMKRKAYTTLQLQAIIAESQDTGALLAAALLWAENEPCEEVFKQAADLVGASTLDELWEAFYVTSTRVGFVAVVLAIIHHEILATLNVGEYFARIEIVEKKGEFYRSYGARKRK